MARDPGSREYLVRTLVEQIERTLSAQGSRKALRDLGLLLRGLDEPTLRALLQWQDASPQSRTVAGRHVAGGGGS
jgi:hypothetical protein